jgi:hypothetical protein
VPESAELDLQDVAVMATTTTTSPAPDDPGRKPRGELFADPSARAVWAAFCALDEGLQHDLLRAVQTRLAAVELRATPKDERVARAVAALREASDLLEREGRSGLTVDEYRCLRADNPDAGWPPDGSIRRWLGGSWNDALKRARLAPVPDGDLVIRELGAGFTDDELLAAVRQCAADPRTGPVPTLSGFIGWARSPEVKLRPGRRPVSQGPFDRAFGGWHKTLLAAGLLGDGEPLGATNAAAGNRFARGYAYTEETIGEALRAAAKRLGRSPRTTEYEHWRNERLRAQAAGDEPRRAIPSYGAINKMYASWDDALQAAGLERLGGSATRSNPRRPRTRSLRRWTDDELLRAICAARDATEGALTTEAYMLWRASEIKDAQKARRLARLPWWHTISKRWGTWARALEAADAWRLRQDRGGS